MAVGNIQAAAPQNIGAVGGGQAGIQQGGVQGKPHPMGQLMHALKSGDIKTAQAIAQQHPELIQKLAAKLQDPAARQKMSERIEQHGGNPQDVLGKLDAFVKGNGAQPAAAQPAAAAPGVAAPKAV